MGDPATYDVAITKATIVHRINERWKFYRALLSLMMDQKESVDRILLMQNKVHHYQNLLSWSFIWLYK